MNEVTTFPSARPPLYKLLHDGASCHGGEHTWSLPKDGQPGEWEEVVGPLVQCKNGFHLTANPSRRWCTDTNELYLVEVDVSAGMLAPKMVVPHADDVDDPTGSYESDEWVVRRVRLVRRVVGDELVELIRTVRPLEKVPAKLYAMLEDATDPNTKFAWPVPPKNAPGEWAEWKGEDGSAEIMHSGDGLRITNDPRHRYRKSLEVWEVEVEGTVWKTDSVAELRATKARLVRRLIEKELDKLGIGVDRSYRRRSTWNFDRYESVRKRDPKGMAPAERFVRIMAEHGDVSTSRDVSEDERRFVYEALHLAVRGGLEFKGPNFFKEIDANPANYYIEAITAGNESACVAIESALGRRPWMWSGRRLNEAVEFKWAGEAVKITSFVDEKDQIVACAYGKKVKTRGAGTSHEDECVTTKVTKRFIIAHAEFDEVAKRYKAFASKSQAYAKKAEWLCAKSGIGKSYLSKALAMCMWFWTKEQHAELDEWIVLWKDAKSHGKKRVANDPLPAFVKQAAADALADAEERDAIHMREKAAVGDEPDHDAFKHYYNYQCAKEAWSAKFDARCTVALSIRATAIGRLERALHAWAVTNFVGQPSEYLDAENNTKRRAKKNAA